VLIVLRLAFKLRIRSSTSFETRDRVLAYYGPLGLLCLLVTWEAGIIAGYTAMDWAVGVTPVRAALKMSGSSVLTLGFAVPHTLPQTGLVFTEAALGLVELALLITFLPNIYSDFHRREREVNRLAVEAGVPPEGVAILIRLHNLERLDAKSEVWTRFTNWFGETGASQTAFPTLALFRSSRPTQSWVTAAGAVLDGAALSVSCLDRPRDLEAELMIRSGYLCLRQVAALFRLPFDADPRPDDPIAVDQAEFDEVWERMQQAGVPLKGDREAAWAAFAGWRVNYDEPLIRLANLTESPIAPWSSDRGLLAGRRATFIERIRQ
jgi:hypothetical protein